jgi:nucleotide-binding universal stress UspA family protein
MYSDVFVNADHDFVRMAAKKRRATRNSCTDEPRRGSYNQPMIKTKSSEPDNVTLPKRILVPIDFSCAAKKALAHAIGLCGGDFSRILLLHVAALLPGNGNSRGGSGFLTAAKERLWDFARSDGMPPNPDLHYAVRAGAPFQEILTVAKENDVDLIVLGIDDSEPFGGLALGHTADRVSRYARCAVLLVRESCADLEDNSRR